MTILHAINSGMNHKLIDSEFSLVVILLKKSELHSKIKDKRETSEQSYLRCKALQDVLVKVGKIALRCLALQQVCLVSE